MLDVDSYSFFDREVCANVKIKAIHSGYFLSRGKKDLRIFCLDYAYFKDKSCHAQCRG